MGKKYQEKMTGKSYEERVRLAEKVGVLKRFRRRLNRNAPRRFANVRRHGNASVNPRLVKEK